jgi:hypothetical protein
MPLRKKKSEQQKSGTELQEVVGGGMAGSVSERSRETRR